MDKHREQNIGDSEKAPALGKRDEIPAPLALLERVGAGAGVEQRELQHAMRRLAHHLERDITSHREPREREFLERGLPQHVGGDVGHRVGAGMVGDPAIGDRGKPRKLWPPHQLVAEQTGNEDKTLFCGRVHAGFWGRKRNACQPSLTAPQKLRIISGFVRRGARAVKGGRLEICWAYSYVGSNQTSSTRLSVTSSRLMNDSLAKISHA